MKIIIPLALTQIFGMLAILAKAENNPEFNLIIALLILNGITNAIAAINFATVQQK